MMPRSSTGWPPRRCPTRSVRRSATRNWAPAGSGLNGPSGQSARMSLNFQTFAPPAPQPLGRVDSVHGALLQQMHVQAVDHGLRLLGERLALGRGHRIAVDDGPELRQRVHCPEIVVRREPEFWNGRHRFTPPCRSGAYLAPVTAVRRPIWLKRPTRT